MKRPLTVPIFCYALIAAAWIVDLFTPQLFVAAILYNGPIALSGVALSTRLTTALVILAQIANIVTGYLNGLQSHHHWDSIAIGDRMLSAASFLLVGYLTTRAQEYAREAGSATERARIAAGEKTLRRALETVRATLNVDLVLRAIVREALKLADADEASLVVRGSQLEVPDIYSIGRGSNDPQLERRPLNPAAATLLQRTAGETRYFSRDGGDPVAGMLLDEHEAVSGVSVRLSGGDKSVVLFVFYRASVRPPQRLLAAFADGCSVALDQAWLFMQLGYRNEQIAAQRDALEDRSRVIRDIVYALAHDLRTPLAAMNMTMQQALEGAYGELPHAYRDVLRTAIVSNAGVRRLVETLLMVARFESGESSTLRERVEVAEQASHVIEELRPLADGKGVALRASCAQAAVLADSSEIRRAMTNLVANALEATPAGGTVTLRVEALDGSVAIVVEDDGYGVPPEQRAQLFQRFAPGGRPFGGGTGLGLYIVRLIAEKLSGHVDYRPREPRGSIFTIGLPAAPVTARA